MRIAKIFQEKNYNLILSKNRHIKFKNKYVIYTMKPRSISNYT